MSAKTPYDEDDYLFNLLFEGAESGKFNLDLPPTKEAYEYMMERLPGQQRRVLRYIAFWLLDDWMMKTFPPSHTEEEVKAFIDDAMNQLWLKFS